jgi:hypothetical protein
MPETMTKAEAEVLAVMLASATRKVSRTKARVPGSDKYDYVWEKPYELVHDMCEGFYAIVPMEYGVFV